MTSAASLVKDQPVLEVSNVFFSFNNKDWALQDVNIEIHEREFVGVVGPNGGGKTTFVKLILGILKPDLGKIKIFGDTIHTRRRDIGYFPQIKEVDTDFPITVSETILGARISTKIIGFVTKKDREIVERVMKMVDIYELKDRKLNELSGGQRNRVFLARALATEPKILILDEPTAGLDVTLQKMFLETLKSLKKSLTILIVDHNLELLEQYVDKFLCINRCMAHGINTHEVIAKDDGSLTGECLDE